MIEKGYFFIELDGNEVLDMASLTPKQWREVDERAKMIVAAKQTQNEKIAFIAAFLNLVSEMQNMKKSFSSDQH